MTKIDTVLFDMDGTVLDTLGDLSAAAQKVCRSFGYPLVLRSEVETKVGHGIDQLVKDIMPPGATDSDLQQAVTVFKKYYSQHYLDSSCPYPGIINLLETLTAAELKLAVISNKADEFTQKINEQLFGKYIKVAIGAKPEMKLKPDPEPVLKGLSLLGSTALSAVYVGDSEVDFQTAKNAGLRFVACTWGMRGKAKLIEAGVPEHLIADTPANVMEIIAILT